MDTIFKIESYETFKMAISELLKQNHTSSQYSVTGIATNIIDAAKDDLRKLLIIANFDINKVSEKILNSNWDVEKAKHFVSLLEESKIDLLHSVIAYYNSTYGETVTDFSWVVKLILGTSESKVIRYPLMQLTLASIHSNGKPRQKLYEMNKEVLLVLIKHLESNLD